MEQEALLRLTVEGLLLSLALSLPALGGGLLGGLLAWLLARGRGLQSQTAWTGLRLLGVAAALAISGPWIGEQILEFGLRVIETMGHAGSPAGMP